MKRKKANQSESSSDEFSDEPESKRTRYGEEKNSSNEEIPDLLNMETLNDNASKLGYRGKKSIIEMFKNNYRNN